jgi:hypothetical protein
MPIDSSVTLNAVSASIQLAIAPVFLLTGIGAILSVLTTRLGRIVDRARLLQRRLAMVKTAEYRDLLQAEVSVLHRRINIINWAMRLSVGSALLICVVIMSLFIGVFGHFIATGILLAILFVFAMVLLVISLIFLLFEVSISTRRMLESVEHLIQDEPL